MSKSTTPEILHSRDYTSWEEQELGWSLLYKSNYETRSYRLQHKYQETNGS